MNIYTNNAMQTCPVNGALRYWLKEQRAHELADALDVHAAATADEFAERLEALGAFALGMASFAQDLADGLYEVEPIDRSYMAVGDVCGRMAGLARLADANARDAAALALRAADAAHEGDLAGALRLASHAVEFAIYVARDALAVLRLAPLTTGERSVAGGALWTVGHLLCTIDRV
ncbi:hypothetical protein SAMN02787142_2099 [Burkholderia sp. WP9]|uniref:hypothetical protein n=1 Tax=Burkholderia sp. WP9 TaxID=1500263 RepID=UPI00089A17B3|nr:hypothetical protein [Burkholderia sp. WP9]SEC86950.1 hypothetical protein SAMN02787142_2099 [Burkholderia sp. WP9]